MKNLRIKTAGIFLLAIMTTAGLEAQRYRHGGGPAERGANREAVRTSAIERLELTEEQQASLKGLQTEHFNTMKPLRTKLTELRARERTLLVQEEVDMKSVNQLIDEETDLLNQMKKLRVEHRLSVQEILTDEQQMLLEQRKMRRENFRSYGNEHRGSPRGERPFRRDLG